MFSSGNAGTLSRRVVRSPPDDVVAVRGAPDDVVAIRGAPDDVVAISGRAPDDVVAVGRAPDGVVTIRAAAIGAPDDVVAIEVPQMMLSPSKAVPQMMLVLLEVPQMMLAPESVPQMMLAPVDGAPDDVVAIALGAPDDVVAVAIPASWPSPRRRCCSRRSWTAPSRRPQSDGCPRSRGGSRSPASARGRRRWAVVRRTSPAGPRRAC